MLNSVEVIPNAISSYAQDTLEKIVTDFKFPWYYRPTTIDIDPRINKHQFVHFVYDGVGKDYNYENVMRFFSFLPEFQTHTLHRVQINLNTPYKRRYIDNLKHIDLIDANDKPVKGGCTYLYYIIDSDGPTTFYGKWGKYKVHPKKGTLVKFPCDIVHSCNVPFKYEQRIVLNIVFQPKRMKQFTT